MRIKYFTSAITAVALSTCTLALHATNANNDNEDHNWMPRQPVNTYWQAPKWSSFNLPSTDKTAPPAHTPPGLVNQALRPHTRQAFPSYRPRHPANNPDANYPRLNRPDMNRPNMAPPAPRGPYTPSYGPDNGASAYNIPGYHPNRNYRRNKNKFWGRSGPGKWMNPNKGDMEQGWDDMINAPSRMGKMPGGWTAPEVTMPNPIDMGDQIQENVEDLPDQIRDMNVGDDIK